MNILAIDTSCDDTSVAISRDDVLLANERFTDEDAHSKWGGVVPILAKRNHIEKLPTVIQSALNKSELKLEEIDIFAVTYGPGLAVSLEVGIAKAKELAKKYDKPLIAVNHMIGHIYSGLAKTGQKLAKNGQKSARSGTEFANLEFPALAILISGGHTEFVLMNDHLEFEKIGETLDDALGEAYDKVARYLEWGYPGGPIIEKLALEGDPSAYNLPIPMKHSKEIAFSYSGLKTAFMQIVKEIGEPEEVIQDSSHQDTGGYKPTKTKQVTYKLTENQKKNLAASFQFSATKHLTDKLKLALEKYPVKQILMGGGVVFNKYIRSEVAKVASKFGAAAHWPEDPKLLTDNAGMIAVAAYQMAQKEQFVEDIDGLDRVPRLSIS